MASAFKSAYRYASHENDEESIRESFHVDFVRPESDFEKYEKVPASICMYTVCD